MRVQKDTLRAALKSARQEEEMLAMEVEQLEKKVKAKGMAEPFKHVSLFGSSLSSGQRIATGEQHQQSTFFHEQKDGVASTGGGSE